MPKDQEYIEVPSVTHEETQDAADLVSIITEKYDISEEDVDILYNAFVTTFIRGRLLGKTDGQQEATKGN